MYETLDMFFQRFYTWSAVNGAHEQTEIQKNLNLNQDYIIEISQRKLGTKYIFSIKMDSVEYKSMENTQAQVFSNMKLYVTDPWFAASDCVVKHISYEFYDHLGGGTLLGNFTAYTKDLKHW